MKIKGLVLPLVLTLALLPTQISADPVFYYLYENPVPPDMTQQYGPAGDPGSDIVCLANGACGVKASLVITLGSGENAHPPNEIFADWRMCLAYARELALANPGGFRFFCLGTDNRAFW